MSQIIDEAITDRFIDVHTSLPGAVQSYNAITRTADIEIQVKRVLEDENGEHIYESIGILTNVPVWCYRSAKCYVHIPLEAGDTGLILFSETAIGQWRAVLGEAYPDDIGRHTLSGAVFLPGLSKDADVIADTLTGGIRMAVDGLGFVEINKTTGQVNINDNFKVLP